MNNDSTFPTCIFEESYRHEEVRINATYRIDIVGVFETPNEEGQRDQRSSHHSSDPYCWLRRYRVRVLAI